MKIYSMTATFGKLENQTLTLKPGLNVIHAPNEWGKSTWCAFLVSMLYGMETRVKSTKTALADKERYAPWSGVPMSGRLELRWQGKDITIERWTKGRTPLGEFRAYETHSGIVVPELTSATCGQQLLGVERSVFLRSGFLRLSDLPVTEDDALRRRLNSLVTTGDESNTADELAQKLKELKNKCRYNRTGLIPQAEAERNDLRLKLEQLEQHRETAARIRCQQEEVILRRAALENHRQALLYQEAEQTNRRIAEAKMQQAAAEDALQVQERICASLPSEETAQQMAQSLQQLNQRSMALNLEQQMLPTPPVKPDLPVCFEDLQRVRQDQQRYFALENEKKQRGKWLTAVVIAAAVVLFGLILGMMLHVSAAVCGVGAGVVAAAVALTFARNAMKTKESVAEMDALLASYSGYPPKDWVMQGEAYSGRMAVYQQQQVSFEEKVGLFREKQQQLIAQIQELTQGQSMEQCLQTWQGVSEKWQVLQRARKGFADAAAQTQTLLALVKQVEVPKEPDALTLSAEQTQRELAELEKRQEMLHHQYGQNQGLMASLGEAALLRQKLAQVESRLERLHEMQAALELAQSTLVEAIAELQRRFAPRIAQEAQRIFASLTHGRYDRLTISQDLSLNTGAEDESVLHTALWRSEGTVDQMYLALRLAVAKELIPDAPLILDDALVRFDDVRHGAAMEILQAEGEERQILLFTCQSRELTYA